MSYKIYIILFAISCSSIYESEAQLGAIREFVQYNLAGLPAIHENKHFKFDPEISLKRRAQWEELHGKQGEKLIERIGLGIDGNEQARLEAQRARDEGHLGGLNYFRP